MWHSRCGPSLDPTLIELERSNESFNLVGERSRALAAELDSAEPTGVYLGLGSKIFLVDPQPFPPLPYVFPGRKSHIARLHYEQSSVKPIVL